MANAPTKKADSFPWLSGCPPVYRQPFRDNIVEFLKDYGSLVPLKLQLTTAWIVPLKHKSGAVKLHVYEEHLDEASGAPSICDQCRNMGWQHHPVSTRRYHFVLPSPAVLSDPDQLPAIVEAAAAGRVDAAKAAVSSLAVEVYDKDPKDSAFNAPASIFDSTTHCLHGVIHANGFGHLLRMNGRDGAAATAAAIAAAAHEEGGDAAASAAAAAAATVGTSLAGPELMGLWDALCSTLRAREVSVEDVSNKSSMLLRLLYSAAHMRTWYGKWGYGFGRAAFNYGAEEHAAAVRVIHNAPVANLLRDMEGVDATAHKILRTYWRMPPSMPEDATFGQLLQRMLFYISRPDHLKEARVQHIAAAKAAAATKGGGQEQGSGTGPAPGAGAAAPGPAPAAGGPSSGPVAMGAAVRKTPRGAKTPLSGGVLPPAKRGRRSGHPEDCTLGGGASTGGGVGRAMATGTDACAVSGTGAGPDTASSGETAAVGTDAGAPLPPTVGPMPEASSAEAPVTAADCPVASLPTAPAFSSCPTPAAHPPGASPTPMKPPVLDTPTAVPGSSCDDLGSCSAAAHPPEAPSAPAGPIATPTMPSADQAPDASPCAGTPAPIPGPSGPSAAPATAPAPPVSATTPMGPPAVPMTVPVRPPPPPIGMPTAGPVRPLGLPLATQVRPPGIPVAAPVRPPAGPQPGGLVLPTAAPSGVSGGAPGVGPTAGLGALPGPRPTGPGLGVPRPPLLPTASAAVAAAAAAVAAAAFAALTAGKVAGAGGAGINPFLPFLTQQAALLQSPLLQQFQPRPGQPPLLNPFLQQLRAPLPRPQGLPSVPRPPMPQLPQLPRPLLPLPSTTQAAGQIAPPQHLAQLALPRPLQPFPQPQPRPLGPQHLTQPPGAQPQLPSFPASHLQTAPPLSQPPLLPQATQSPHLPPPLQPQQQEPQGQQQQQQGPQGQQQQPSQPSTQSLQTQSQPATPASGQSTSAWFMPATSAGTLGAPGLPFAQSSPLALPNGCLPSGFVPVQGSQQSPGVGTSQLASQQSQQPPQVTPGLQLPPQSPQPQQHLQQASLGQPQQLPMFPLLPGHLPQWIPQQGPVSQPPQPQNQQQCPGGQQQHSQPQNLLPFQQWPAFNQLMGQQPTGDVTTSDGGGGLQAGSAVAPAAGNGTPGQGQVPGCGAPGSASLPPLPLLTLPAGLSDAASCGGAAAAAPAPPLSHLQPQRTPTHGHPPLASPSLQQPGNPPFASPGSFPALLQPLQQAQLGTIGNPATQPPTWQTPLPQPPPLQLQQLQLLPQAAPPQPPQTGPLRQPQQMPSQAEPSPPLLLGAQAPEQQAQPSQITPQPSEPSRQPSARADPQQQELPGLSVSPAALAALQHLSLLGMGLDGPAQEARQPCLPPVGTQDSPLGLPAPGQEAVGQQLAGQEAVGQQNAGRDAVGQPQGLQASGQEASTQGCLAGGQDAGMQGLQAAGLELSTQEGQATGQHLGTHGPQPTAQGQPNPAGQQVQQATWAPQASDLGLSQAATQSSSGAAAATAGPGPAQQLSCPAAPSFASTQQAQTQLCGSSALPEPSCLQSSQQPGGFLWPQSLPLLPDGSQFQATPTEAPPSITPGPPPPLPSQSSQLGAAPWLWQGMLPASAPSDGTGPPAATQAWTPQVAPLVTGMVSNSQQGTTEQPGSVIGAAQHAPAWDSFLNMGGQPLASFSPASTGLVQQPVSLLQPPPSLSLGLMPGPQQPSQSQQAELQSAPQPQQSGQPEQQQPGPATAPLPPDQALHLLSQIGSDTPLGSAQGSHPKAAGAFLGPACGTAFQAAAGAAAGPQQAHQGLDQQSSSPGACLSTPPACSGQDNSTGGPHPPVLTQPIMLPAASCPSEPLQGLPGLAAPPLNGHTHGGADAHKLAPAGASDVSGDMVRQTQCGVALGPATAPVPQAASLGEGARSALEGQTPAGVPAGAQQQAPAGQSAQQSHVEDAETGPAALWAGCTGGSSSAAAGAAAAAAGSQIQPYATAAGGGAGVDGSSSLGLTSTSASLLPLVPGVNGPLPSGASTSGVGPDVGASGPCSQPLQAALHPHQPSQQPSSFYSDAAAQLAALVSAFCSPQASANPTAPSAAAPAAAAPTAPASAGMPQYPFTLAGWQAPMPGSFGTATQLEHGGVTSPAGATGGHDGSNVCGGSGGGDNGMNGYGTAGSTAVSGAAAAQALTGAPHLTVPPQSTVVAVTDPPACMPAAPDDTAAPSGRTAGPGGDGAEPPGQQAAGTGMEVGSAPRLGTSAESPPHAAPALGMPLDGLAGFAGSGREGQAAPIALQPAWQQLMASELAPAPALQAPLAPEPAGSAAGQAGAELSASEAASDGQLAAADQHHISAVTVAGAMPTTEPTITGNGADLVPGFGPPWQSWPNRQAGTTAFDPALAVGTPASAPEMGAMQAAACGSVQQTSGQGTASAEGAVGCNLQSAAEAHRPEPTACLGAAAGSQAPGSAPHQQIGVGDAVQGRAEQGVTGTVQSPYSIGGLVCSSTTDAMSGAAAAVGAAGFHWPLAPEPFVLDPGTSAAFAQAPAPLLGQQDGQGLFSASATPGDAQGGSVAGVANGFFPGGCPAYPVPQPSSQTSVTWPSFQPFAGFMPCTAGASVDPASQMACGTAGLMPGWAAATTLQPTNGYLSGLGFQSASGLPAGGVNPTAAAALESAAGATQSGPAGMACWDPSLGWQVLPSNPVSQAVYAPCGTGPEDHQAGVADALAGAAAAQTTAEPSSALPSSAGQASHQGAVEGEAAGGGEQPLQAPTACGQEAVVATSADAAVPPAGAEAGAIGRAAAPAAACGGGGGGLDCEAENASAGAVEGASAAGGRGDGLYADVGAGGPASSETRDDGPAPDSRAAPAEETPSAAASTVPSAGAADGVPPALAAEHEAGVSGSGAVGGGRGRGHPKLSGAHIAPAPDDLPKEPVSDLQELHAEVESDMNLRDCQRAMDSMLQALQSHCHQQWLARLQLRDVMMVTYRDFKILDWVLKQVANVRIGGYAVYRSRYTVTRSYYYRLERLPGTPEGAPLAYTVPMPPHGPFARKQSRAGVRGRGASHGTPRAHNQHQAASPAATAMVAARGHRAEAAAGPAATALAPSEEGVVAGASGRGNDGPSETGDAEAPAGETLQRPAEVKPTRAALSAADRPGAPDSGTPAVVAEERPEGASPDDAVPEAMRHPPLPPSLPSAAADVTQADAAQSSGLGAAPGAEPTPIAAEAPVRRVVASGQNKDGAEPVASTVSGVGAPNGPAAGTEGCAGEASALRSEDGDAMDVGRAVGGMGERPPWESGMEDRRSDSPAQPGGSAPAPERDLGAGTPDDELDTQPLHARRKNAAQQLSPWQDRLGKQQSEFNGSRPQPSAAAPESEDQPGSAQAKGAADAGARRPRLGGKGSSVRPPGKVRSKASFVLPAPDGGAIAGVSDAKAAPSGRTQSGGVGGSAGPTPCTTASGSTGMGTAGAADPTATAATADAPEPAMPDGGAGGPGPSSSTGADALNGAEGRASATHNSVGGSWHTGASWRGLAKEHQSEGQALLDTVLESRIEQALPGTGGGRPPRRVPRELRYLMSKSTLSKLKQQEQQQQRRQRQQQPGSGGAEGEGGHQVEAMGPQQHDDGQQQTLHETAAAPVEQQLQGDAVVARPGAESTVGTAAADPGIEEQVIDAAENAPGPAVPGGAPTPWIAPACPLALTAPDGLQVTPAVGGMPLPGASEADPERAVANTKHEAAADMAADLHGVQAMDPASEAYVRQVGREGNGVAVEEQGCVPAAAPGEALRVLAVDAVSDAQDGVQPALAGPLTDQGGHSGNNILQVDAGNTAVPVLARKAGEGDAASGGLQTSDANGVNVAAPRVVGEVAGRPARDDEGTGGQHSQFGAAGGAVTNPDTTSHAAPMNASADGGALGSGTAVAKAVHVAMGSSVQLQEAGIPQPSEQQPALAPPQHQTGPQGAPQDLLSSLQLPSPSPLPQVPQKQQRSPAPPLPPPQQPSQAPPRPQRARVATKLVVEAAETVAPIRRQRRASDPTPQAPQAAAAAGAAAAGKKRDAKEALTVASKDDDVGQARSDHPAGLAVPKKRRSARKGRRPAAAVSAAAAVIFDAARSQPGPAKCPAEGPPAPAAVAKPAAASGAAPVAAGGKPTVQASGPKQASRRRASAPTATKVLDDELGLGEGPASATAGTGVASAAAAAGTASTAAAPAAAMAAAVKPTGKAPTSVRERQAKGTPPVSSSGERPATRAAKPSLGLKAASGPDNAAAPQGPVAAPAVRSTLAGVPPASAAPRGVARAAAGPPVEKAGALPAPLTGADGGRQEATRRSAPAPAAARLRVSPPHDAGASDGAGAAAGVDAGSLAGGATAGSAEAPGRQGAPRSPSGPGSPVLSPGGTLRIRLGKLPGHGAANSPLGRKQQPPAAAAASVAVKAEPMDAAACTGAAAAKSPARAASTGLLRPSKGLDGPRELLAARGRPKAAPVAATLPGASGPTVVAARAPPPPGAPGAALPTAALGKRRAKAEAQRSDSQVRSQDGPAGSAQNGKKRQKLTNSATGTANTAVTAPLGSTARAGGKLTPGAAAGPTVSTAAVGPRATTDGTPAGAAATAAATAAMDTACSVAVRSSPSKGPYKRLRPLAHAQQRPATGGAVPPPQLPVLPPMLQHARTAVAASAGEAAVQVGHAPGVKVEEAAVPSSVGAAASGQTAGAPAASGAAGKPPKGPPSRRSSQLGITSPAATEAQATVAATTAAQPPAAQPPLPSAAAPAASSGDATDMAAGAPLPPPADKEQDDKVKQEEVFPSPPATSSGLVAKGLGPAASQEPCATVLKLLPLVYVHKARFAATPGESTAGGAAGGASAGAGGKRGRPGSHALALAAIGAQGGGTSFDPEPPAPTNPYVQPGKAHHNTSLTYINDQTQCDMQYLYCSILRLYKPALSAAVQLLSKRGAAAVASTPPSIKLLDAPYLAAAVQLLKDTKYYVKEYGGGTAAAAAAATAADGKPRALVAIQLDEEAPVVQRPRTGRGGGKGSAAAAAAAALASVAATAAHAPPPRVPRQMTLTPPEIVVVEPAPGGAGVTVGDLKRAAAATFSATYRLCKPRSGNVVVTSIVRGLDAKVLKGGDSAVLVPPYVTAAPTSPAAGQADGVEAPQALDKAPSPQPQSRPQALQVLVVRCSGLDLDRRWRHAGGPEDWRVACLCGTQDDDGERMIACDVCGVWSHTRCNDIPDDIDEPPSFVCRECSKAGKGGAGK